MELDAPFVQVESQLPCHLDIGDDFEIALMAVAALVVDEFAVPSVHAEMRRLFHWDLVEGFGPVEEFAALHL